MRWTVVAAAILSALPAGPRWLRVAQREHYLAPSVSRFAGRWWAHRARALALAAVGVVAAIATWWWLPAGLVAAAVVAIGPSGLGVRGRTSPLSWTRRMARVAVVAGSGVAAGAVAGAIWHPGIVVWTVALLPLIVDGALWLLAPLEHRLGNPWVERATERLRASGATVVAITGSYGKTTTKGYVAHLVGELRSTVASPASFNNRMGLARAVNEHVGPGVAVFVAEMGAYGPGEIAELCSWLRPEVSVITAIGPVHLERFGSEDRIVAAKREILAGAGVAVLNVDDPRLAQVAAEEDRHRRVIRVATTSVGSAADVVVEQGSGRVTVGGRHLGSAPPSAHLSNLACALGVVLGLSLEPAEVVDRLETLPSIDHRRSVTTSERGVRVIDDTYNANPAGAAAALETLAGLKRVGRRVIVTPGLVEMGKHQHAANVHLAEAAAKAVDDLIVVGYTNRAALTEGARRSEVRLHHMATRDEAVTWARTHLRPGDAVLYENDLPDHHP